ncbi:hypothetical protein RJ639_027358 [Escallonia herrerae]|uniref:DUF4005 domain-containing protein n=1 Tax=Escallonia herrerae TaxID=1293975 RepID=A0AA88X376_9ASTE|nr:hypothetical protein RJ639_027358 [Escallonia herrerae]
MGKKGGSSWLTAVKRAFRSPSKDPEKRTKHSHHDEQDEEEEKKREKRRWLFRKPTIHDTVTPQALAKTTNDEGVGGGAAANVSEASGAVTEQRHAVAVAVATAAAAEAAVATAQAAVEVARLTRPHSNNVREHFAAARRALRALKGLVKLQALVRGHNVRKQAKMTLQCMQALVRVQARVLDQRMRQSNDGSRKSAFSDTNSLWESRYLQDIFDRKSMASDFNLQSRDGSSIADDWDERPHTIEEVKAMLQNRKEAALKRERNLSHAFSQQMWRSDRNASLGSENELREKHQWLDRWMGAKPWDGRGRASTDQREAVKTVEIDTSQPYSYLAPNFRRSNQHQYHQHHQRPNANPAPSPLHRAHQNLPHHPSPVTPSPSKTRPLQVRSASPRCGREEKSYQTAQTPSLRSNYYYTGGLQQHIRGATCGVGGGAMPNYMAATESAKARVRSQSAPRQRLSTPDRERAGSAKKRLSFPVPDPYNAGYGHNMKSPSFKSISRVHLGIEQQSNYSSYCTDSLGGEISPSSTSDLRRWLR